MDENVREVRAVKSQAGLKLVGTEEALKMKEETEASKKDLAMAKSALAQANVESVEAQKAATSSRVRLRGGRDATVYLAMELNHGRIAKLPAGYATPGELDLFEFTRSLVANLEGDLEMSAPVGVVQKVRELAVADHAQEVVAKQRYADWTRKVILAEGRLELAIVAAENHIRANAPEGSAARNAIKREIAPKSEGSAGGKKVKKEVKETPAAPGTAVVAA